jgi:hypothetical protein
LIPLTISPTRALVNDFELQTQIQQLSHDFLKHSVDEETLKKLGATLWQKVHENYLHFNDFRTLIIQTEDADLHNIPWEILYHPEYGFLAKHPDFTLSRCLTDYQPSAPIIEDSPLKILHFSAQPSDIKADVQLAIEIEQHFLKNALNSYIHSGQVILQTAKDGCFSTLENLLLQNWHVVIVTGHSFLAESPSFLFEDAQEKSHIVPVHILAQIFKNSSVSCVLLSSCESGKSVLENNSLALQLFKTGIPHVIGMRESLIDRAGSVFVQAFCEALVHKARMNSAVQQGRIAMVNVLKNKEIWKNSRLDFTIGQWSLPLLFSIAPTQILFHDHFSLQPFKNRVFLGTPITLPDVFLGRRRELRLLTESLIQGKIKRLCIHGQAGIGKTALVGKLAENLLHSDYQIIVYQFQLSNTIDFNDILNTIFSTQDLQSVQNKLLKNKWAFWFDHLPTLENANDTAVNAIRDFLRLPFNDNVLIIMTSRRKMADEMDFNHSVLAPPSFNDFCHYAHYLELPYKNIELRLIYRLLNGNFSGLQLLQTLDSIKNLKKQLLIVKRYLLARSRDC